MAIAPENVSRTRYLRPTAEDSRLPSHRTGAATVDGSAPSAWQRAERLAEVMSGTALLAYAAKSRSTRSLGLALAGAPLVFHGFTGRWPVSRTVARAIAPQPLEVETSVTINRSKDDLYAFWRRLENLPRFMKNLQSVESLEGRRSRWVGKSPLGTDVEWEAEVIEDRPGQLLSWRSCPGSRVLTAGSVLFEEAPGNRGTVVRVTMAVRPPGQGLGKALGRVLRPVTERQVREDLRRFKSLMEAGEVPTTKGQPAGHRSALNVHNPV